MKKGMIKISVFYPGGKGRTFDMNYYCEKHMPMVSTLLGKSLKGATVDKGISGEEPGSKPVYVAVGNLYFASLESFQKSFVANIEKIGADIPNYTNIEPEVLVSEVMM